MAVEILEHDVRRRSTTDKSALAEIDTFTPKQQVSQMFYIAPIPLYKTEKPFFLNIPVHRIAGARQTNVTHTSRDITFTDIRGHESLFSLDKTGFQISKMPSLLPYDDFSNPEAITRDYFCEVKALLQSLTGAESVLPWDYQVRRSDPSLPGNSRGSPGKAQPFASVHGDQTANAALRRLQYFHPEEAARYCDKRIQIINVWRPLRGPVYDHPISMCDYRTIKPTDRVPTDIVFPDYLGETYNFFPDPSHRFYYLDGQMPDEACLIKCFDSSTSKDPTIAQFCPHAAFPYVGDKSEGAMARESIEVRCFVFYGE